MTKQSCGYQGHVCGLKRVQFISRYWNTNDYCVSGHRVSLTDEGVFGESTIAEREAIRLFELDRYAEYLRWRVEFRQRIGSVGSIIPFESNYVRSI